MKSILKKYIVVFGVLTGMFFTVGCASVGRYEDKTADINRHIVNNDFQNASKAIDDNKFLKKSRNHLLYLMEKGKVEHMLGNYKKSNDFLEQAYIMIDDRIKAGVGQTIAANFTNPMAAPYKGEDFEKVTIHYYKALNFFQLGDPNAALVEARRINIKLNELNDRYKKNKNKYAKDAFSQILQGILYEATGDINNAFIAYRNALEIYEQNDGVYFEVPVPVQLIKDVKRTAKAMGFIQEYDLYNRQYPNITEDPYHEGEAILFWENGLGPQKDQTILSASTVGNTFIATYDDGQDDLVIPIPSNADIGINAIAIPRYKQRENYYRNASITLPNGQEKQLEEAQSFFPIARQSLRDRMLREALNIILRLGTKKAGSKLLGEIVKEISGNEDAGKAAETIGGAAGAIVEKADTRNWQSLPATISYVRIPLEENKENTVSINRYGAAGTDRDQITIPYRKGLQLISYFDLGRSTSGFAQIKSSEQ